MGKNFYKDSQLSAGADQILIIYGCATVTRTGLEKTHAAAFGRPQSVDRKHMHAQATPGESVRRKEDPDEKVFSSAEMLSAPQPIMTVPPAHLLCAIAGASQLLRRASLQSERTDANRRISGTICTMMSRVTGIAKTVQNTATKDERRKTSCHNSGIYQNGDDQNFHQSF